MKDFEALKSIWHDQIAPAESQSQRCIEKFAKNKEWSCK
jgi:hypothetical protein